MAKRKGLGKRRRFEIFERDGFSCRYCGKTPPGVILHVDHIIAVIEGGSNEPENLITSCSECNLGKGRKALTASAPLDYQGLADEAAERAAQIAAYGAYSKRLMDEQEELVNVVGRAFFAPDGRNLTFAEGKWRNSVRYFLKKLSLDQVVDAAQIACGKIDGSSTERFRYFCGVCHRRIKQRSSESMSAARSERPTDAAVNAVSMAFDRYISASDAKSNEPLSKESALPLFLASSLVRESALTVALRIADLAHEEGLIDDDIYGEISCELECETADAEAIAQQVSQDELDHGPIHRLRLLSESICRQDPGPIGIENVLNWSALVCEVAGYRTIEMLSVVPLKTFFLMNEYFQSVIESLKTRKPDSPAQDGAQVGEGPK